AGHGNSCRNSLYDRAQAPTHRLRVTGVFFPQSGAVSEIAMSLLTQMFAGKQHLPTAEEALPGRAEPLPTASFHAVSGRPLQGPIPEGMEVACFGMGCFWGAERLFWQTEGVWVTAVGYAGGFTPNPTYRETCTGRTGHAEVVLVVYDPAIVSFDRLLTLFWEEHDPTQGMRQGNDVGTTYRSVKIGRAHV